MYKLKNLLVTTLLFTSIISCKMPALLFHGDLGNNTTVMDAKGRQGWQFNQVIRFGAYKTSKLKRGWTKELDWTFFLKFKKAEQKLSFVQYTPSGDSAKVFSVGKFKSEELPLFKDFLNYIIKYENTYTGTVILNEQTNKSWDFIANNPESVQSKDDNCGIIKGQDGTEIQIKGIDKLEGHSTWAFTTNYGFEFIQDGKSLGAVSVVNDGKVWLKNDLSEEMKLILSSVSSALLSRQSMSASANTNH